MLIKIYDLNFSEAGTLQADCLRCHPIRPNWQTTFPSSVILYLPWLYPFSLPHRIKGNRMWLHAQSSPYRCFINMKEPFKRPFFHHINFLPFISVARTSQTFFIPPISVSLLLNLCLYVSSYFGFKKLQEIKIMTFLTLQLKKCAELNKSSRSSIAHMQKVETMWVWRHPRCQL